MKIAYDNLVDADSNLSVSSFNVATPANFLYRQKLSDFLMFTGKSAEWAMIDAGLGNTFSVDTIGLAGFNFTSGAVIKLQGNTTDSWTTPAFSQTITYSKSTIMEFLDAVEEYRYFRVYIQDSGNSDSLEIGYLFLGLSVDFSVISPDVKIDYVFDTNRNFTRSGGITGAKNYTRREAVVTFPIVDETERQIMITAGTEMANHKTAFIGMWEDSFDVEESIYGIFDNDRLSFVKSREPGLRYTLTLNFREGK